ncbi:hypothetical protein F7725_028020 [Dissostichus mawsoni]|uniref:Sushi domain-containing protein n=1 Tax=Dissostichus mawsoni TaxID=36200 RepID=A0A7J5XEL0_DISMA|nr:hypothetical protein F7725_028020 [Dissostichus mawsoni]
MHSLTFVKGQECTLEQFLNGPLYDPNFDTSGLAATYSGGKQVRVGCNVGFSGFFKLVCIEGKWDPEAEYVIQNHVVIPAIPRMQIFNWKRERILSLGHSRTNYRRCMAEGWDGNIPVCEAQQCPIINVDNHEVQVNGDIEEATFGNVVRFSCKSSSKVLFGSTEMYCDENGEWVGESPKCKEYKEHQVLEFQCKPSFTHAEARSSKCTKQGVRAEWSPTPLCEPITCKLQLPGLKGTSYEPAYRNTFSPGDEVTVNCGDKYWISRRSSVVTTCKRTESGLSDLYAKVTCSQQEVRHVSSWDKYWQQHSNRVSRHVTGVRQATGGKMAPAVPHAPEMDGTQIHFVKCKPSFARAEARSSKCTKQGVRAEWSPTPLCEPITCKLQLPGLKGTSYEPAYRNTFSPGDEVTVNCGDKYWISRDQQASVVTTCKEDGEWTIRPVCQEVTCSQQGVPHGSWDNHWQQTFKAGMLTRYRCETGYRRKDGASSATCTRDGWHPNPLCQGIVK